MPVYDICWLNHAESGIIGTYYEPENKAELEGICKELFCQNKRFDLIGHTSNIYFLPGYNVDYMVSTRKCNTYIESEHEIVCDCGVPVMKLARKMIAEGIKGFEGLIDLPGTVAASVYGNASCYGCSISHLLISCEVLLPDGKRKTLFPNDLRFSKRSSALKRGDLSGVILSIKLRKDFGERDEIKRLADRNHQKRKQTQPAPSDNLGSIYFKSGGWSLYSCLPRMLSKIYEMLFFFSVKDRKERKKRKMEFLFRLIGGTDVFPYVYDWNRYIWKDEHSHKMFWKFHRLHQKMFKESEFEIEIKGLK